MKVTLIITTSSFFLIWWSASQFKEGFFIEFQAFIFLHALVHSTNWYVGHHKVAVHSLFYVLARTLRERVKFFLRFCCCWSVFFNEWTNEKLVKLDFFFILVRLLLQLEPEFTFIYLFEFPAVHHEGQKIDLSQQKFSCFSLSFIVWIFLITASFFLSSH